MKRWYLGLLVFVGGMSVMAAEMAASRLLAPYFGTSLFVWTNLIGVVMIALTAGYYIGGRLADKHPKMSVLTLIMLIGGIYITLLPVLVKPIMGLSVRAIDNASAGLFYGSLIASVLLIGLPMVLLGMVSPMAIRIRAKRLSKIGSTAGNVYALGTAGSIIGTFLPALLTIPFLGTRKTFLLFGCILIVASIFGLKRKWFGLSLLLLLPLWLINPVIKADSHMIEESESLYNYIQVIQHGSTKSLKLNEGHAIHSMYNPHVVLTGGVWDYFSVLPLEVDAERALIVGLAGGTISRTYNEFYPEIRIDGVEIDPQILDVGREHFGLGDQEITLHAEDGRTFLERISSQYDIIITDAYKQPYIPFHLTTKEYFTAVKVHLVPGGIAAINVGVTSSDSHVYRLITNTIASTFTYVYSVHVPNTFNYVVIASDKELFTADSVKAPDAVLSNLWRYAKDKGTRIEFDPEQPILTDDRAPVEMYTDLMILNYALG